VNARWITNLYHRWNIFSLGGSLRGEGRIFLDAVGPFSESANNRQFSAFARLAVSRALDDGGILSVLGPTPDAAFSASVPEKRPRESSRRWQVSDACISDISILEAEDRRKRLHFDRDRRRSPSIPARVMRGAAIGIVCKAPQPGRSKTRLAAAIGEAAASEISACFLRDVAASVEAIPEALCRRGFGVYAPIGAEHIMRQLLPAEFGLLLQTGSNLGYVLLEATQALLEAGHDCVLLVNGDSPTLPTRFLSQAIEALRKPGDRMVLGPASDGGYYLIGLKHPHQHLFADIAWGTETVFRSTYERAAEIGLATTLLPEWYDVDDIQTLRWLQDELAGRSTRYHGGGAATASRAFLKAIALQLNL
jgi:uncharacterized protein